MYESFAGTLLQELKIAKLVISMRLKFLDGNIHM